MEGRESRSNSTCSDTSNGEEESSNENSNTTEEGLPNDSVSMNISSDSMSVENDLNPEETPLPITTPEKAKYKKRLSIHKQLKRHLSKYNGTSSSYEIQKREQKEEKRRLRENFIVFIGGQLNDKERYDDIAYYYPGKHRFTQPPIQGFHPRFARHCSVAIGTKVWTFGGYDGVSKYFQMAVLDTETGIWSYPAVSGTPPIPRTNHSAATVGNKIYIYGGNYSTEPEEKYVVLGDLHIFNTDTLTWEQPKVTGSQPGPRTAHSLVAVGKKLYLFGGGLWEPKPVNRWIKKYNDMYIFNTETNEWKRPDLKGDIPICSFPITFILKYWIFFFGGQKIDENYITNKLFCFDTLTYSCHEITAEHFTGKLPKPRDLGTAAVLGNSVYIFAGSSGVPVNDLDKLTWKVKSKRSYHFPRWD